jgi:hypothetical protein
MAYRIIETRNQKFDGFFKYEAGNIIEGIVRHVVVKKNKESGKETGYIGIELLNPCLASKDNNDFTASVGQCIAVTITAATRVLIGTEDKQVRCTFQGFKKLDKGNYHDWKIEIDDGE